MAELIFFLAAPMAIAAAMGAVVLRNPFFAVLALVVHLLALSLLFLLLRAEFVAVAQVVVYVGAVMILYVFVNGYVGGAADPQGTGPGPRFGWFAVVLGVVVFVELAIAVLGSGLKAIGTEGAPYVAGFGSPAAIGEALLSRYLLAFELASILLLTAAVGAVVLARRRRGEADGGEISVMDLTGTGSMREGVGIINPVPGYVGSPIRSATGAASTSTTGREDDDA